MRKLARRSLTGATLLACVAVVGVLPTSVATAASTPVCPASGHITYQLKRASNPTADQSAAYQLIASAMDQALKVDNCYLAVTKKLSVAYEPSVPTADGNSNGSIRFGARSTMQQITAMHEVAHTLGIGTVASWSQHISGGLWTGTTAIAALRKLTGDPNAQLHADSQHFWPYGLNYTSEVTSSADLVTHCKIVAALRVDVGL